MKKLFALPVIGLILGAVAIATEIKTTDVLPAKQQLSGAVVGCIKIALEKRETNILAAYTTYQNNNLAALMTRKNALLAAWDKTTKLELKSAISEVWKTYKSAMTTFKSNLNTSRKDIWTSYKAEANTCKGTSLLQGIDASTVTSEQ
ncbi:MAG: hypothetical protein NTY80_02990 [candidate division SR1 bacterium]|nr:hypothetical protein [candidate division SR1 bacterium]